MFDNTTDGQMRKKHFILGIISAIACLIFIGSAALVVIGYLNAYASLGLGILAIGTVLYFGGIVLLGVSCVWINKRYSGNKLQPNNMRARRSIEEESVAFIDRHISRDAPRGTLASTVISPVVPSDNIKHLQPDHVKNHHLNSSPKTLQIGNFTTMPSTAIPNNGKAMSDQELDRHHKGIIPKVPCTSNSKSVAGQQQDHCQQRKIPQALCIKDIAATPDAPPPSNGKSVTDQEMSQYYKKDFITSVAASSPNKKKSESEQEMDQHHKDAIPKAPHAKDFSATPAVFPPSHEKSVSDQKQDQCQQRQIPKAPCVKKVTSTPAATLQCNGKSTFNERQNHSQQDIIHKALYCSNQQKAFQTSSSRAQQIRDFTVMPPNSVLNNRRSISDQKLEPCLQDTIRKASLPLIITPIPTAFHLKNQEPSSHQKLHQHHPNIISKAANSTEPTVFDASLPTSGGKNVSHPNQDHHMKDVTQNGSESGKYDTSRGTFPVRERDIVLHYKHDKLQQGIPHMAPCSRGLITKAAADPSSTKQDQQYHATAPLSKDFSSTLDASLPSNVKSLWDKKQHQ